MTSEAGNGDAVLGDLTQAVLGARRGLRRDVAELVRVLHDADLYVPLARSVAGAELGAEIEVDDDLTITPHMLADDDGHLYCALFTRPEILEPMIEQLGWTTNGAPLEYCSVPAKVGLDMALQIVDEEQVLGLVLNPMHESELLLRRLELGSIAQGRALPLVGYVRQIPRQDFEKTLISEAPEPPPPELLAALERTLAELPEITGYEMLSTFNAERDLEPHLTISLRPVRPEIDYDAVTEHVVRALGDRIPAPGYVDIVFDRTPEPRSG